MPTVSRKQLEAMPGFDPNFHLREKPAAPPPAPECDEKNFMADVIKEAKRQGWKVFHVYNSSKSEPGWPDLYMLRGPRCIVRELKVPPNKTTPEQDEWLAALREAGHDAEVWNPKDWQEIIQTLK
jgi:hypothetical protein